MAIDPFGNKIIIRQERFLSSDPVRSGEEILDDLTTVIEKPAMMFKINGSKPQLCYLRAVGWNKTLLISANKRNHHFEVTSLEMDPPAQRIVQLYGQGIQVI